MRTGIFGGSFDPPHKGHIEIALAAKKELGLDRIIMVPTGQAPHKPDIEAETFHRVNMCRSLCEKYGFELSLFEAKKKGNCYTADLLEHFASVYPDDKFFLIVGGDSLDYMDKWYQPERIFKMCRVVVARRSGVSDEKADMLRKKYGAEIDFLPFDLVDISSTEVREKISCGQGISGLIEPETTEYIRENNLYR